MLRFGFFLAVIVLAGCSASKQDAQNGFRVFRYPPETKSEKTPYGQFTVSETSKGVAVTIFSDGESSGALLGFDVLYAADSWHPSNAEITGAVPDSVTGAFLDQVPGCASLGIAPKVPVSIASGEIIARLDFELGPSKQAASLFGVHSNPSGVADVIGDNPTNGAPDLPNTRVTVESPSWATDLTWYSAWMIGDGNENGNVDLYDITRIGGFLNKHVIDDWRGLPGDYDGNGDVTVSDISLMGKYFSESVDGYYITVRDDTAGSGSIRLADIPWEAFTPPIDYSNKAVSDLGAVFKSWNYRPDPSELASHDANLNGTIVVSITPYRGSEQGVTSDFTIVGNSGD